MALMRAVRVNQKHNQHSSHLYFLKTLKCTVPLISQQEPPFGVKLHDFYTLQQQFPDKSKQLLNLLQQLACGQSSAQTERWRTLNKSKTAAASQPSETKVSGLSLSVFTSLSQFLEEEGEKKSWACFYIITK